MSAVQRQSVTVAEPRTDERQPTDSELSVVFKGDGEPKTARETMRRLSEFDETVGLEEDAYTMGGTVERLERRFAEMMGKEAAVFIPTGSLANHLAIRKHCGVRSAAIVQEQSHLYHDTGDTVPRLSGINLIPLAPGRTCFSVEELEEAVNTAERARVDSPLGAVMVESPVRRQAGQIVPYDQMREIIDFCRRRGLPTHYDGARLYMMSAATGVKPAEYAALFDSVYISLYKYFGAPFGALLAGSEAFTSDLFQQRRMFGASLSSGGYLAAAVALSGMDGFEGRFALAMKKAEELFAGLNSLAGIGVGRFEHGSNIFPLELAPEIDREAFLSHLRERWVFVYPNEEEPARTYLTVNTTILRQSNEELVSAFEDALAKSRRPAP